MDLKDCLIQNREELLLVHNWMSKLADDAYAASYDGFITKSEKLWKEFDDLFEEVSMFEYLSMTEKEFWRAA